MTDAQLAIYIIKIYKVKHGMLLSVSWVYQNLLKWIISIPMLSLCNDLLGNWGYISNLTWKRKHIWQFIMMISIKKSKLASMRLKIGWIITIKRIYPISFIIDYILDT